MPELDEKLKHYAGAEDRALWREEAKDENYDLAGENLFIFLSFAFIIPRVLNLLNYIQ